MSHNHLFASHKEDTFCTASNDHQTSQNHVAQMYGPLQNLNVAKFQGNAVQAIDGGHLNAERLSSWAEVAAKYRAALRAEKRSDMERALAQNAVNPVYVARNHVMQAAIARAEAGDYSEVCTKSSAASHLKLMLMTIHWRRPVT